MKYIKIFPYTFLILRYREKGQNLTIDTSDLLLLTNKPSWSKGFGRRITKKRFRTPDYNSLTSPSSKNLTRFHPCPSGVTTHFFAAESLTSGYNYSVAFYLKRSLCATGSHSFDFYWTGDSTFLPFIDRDSTFHTSILILLQLFCLIPSDWWQTTLCSMAIVVTHFLFFTLEKFKISFGRQLMSNPRYFSGIFLETF